MHGNQVCRVLFEPAVELVFVCDVDGEEARVAFVVAVVFGVFAAGLVFVFAAADEVYGGEVGGLQFVPEFGAPADDFRDAVAKGHVADWCGLGGGEGEDEGEEVSEGDHLESEDF